MRQTLRPSLQGIRPVITSLVVDESAWVRRLLRGMLEADGYLVHEATDGHSALALLRRNRLRYAVLLDDVLPGLTGWELLYAAELEDHRLSVRVEGFVREVVPRLGWNQLDRQGSGDQARPLQAARYERLLGRILCYYVMLSVTIQNGQPRSPAQEPPGLTRY